MNTTKITATIALVTCFVTTGCGKTSVNQSLTPHNGTLAVNESGPWERDTSFAVNDSYTPFQECKKEHTPDLVQHYKDGRLYADAYCACKIYGGFDERCPLNPRFRMYGGMMASNVPYGPGFSVAGLSGSATPTGATTNAQGTAAGEAASKDAVKHLMTVFEDHDRRLNKVEDASDATAKLATALIEQPQSPAKAKAPSPSKETPASKPTEPPEPTKPAKSSFAKDLEAKVTTWDSNGEPVKTTTK